MITITDTMLIQLAVASMFALLLSAFIAFIGGIKLGRILEEENSIKKQSDYEDEILELTDLECDVRLIEHQEKIDQLQQALLEAKSDNKYMAMDWVSSLPNHPWPLWNLAKAYDKLNEDINVKRTLIRLQKEHPNWNPNVDEWLQKVNARLESKATQ